MGNFFSHLMPYSVCLLCLNWHHFPLIWWNYFHDFVGNIFYVFDLSFFFSFLYGYNLWALSFYRVAHFLCDPFLGFYTFNIFLHWVINPFSQPHLWDRISLLPLGSHGWWYFLLRTLFNTLSSLFPVLFNFAFLKSFSLYWTLFPCLKLLFHSTACVYSYSHHLEICFLFEFLRHIWSHYFEIIALCVTAQSSQRTLLQGANI